MAACKRCKSKALVIDDVTGGTVCSSCGIVQDFQDYQHSFGGVSGPEGTFVRLGTSGTGTDYSYHDRKLFESNHRIEDIAFRLSFSEARIREVKSMIEKVTDGEFGLGSWFNVLVGACCYIVMRQNGKALPISEVIVAVGCELYEMGKMVNRVVDFLGLELKEFDLVGLLERTIRGFSGFSEVDEEKVDLMVKQGNFVIQCAIKWFLTTGRRPGPVVAAVLVFVAAVNGVGVKVEDVAKEMNVVTSTCKLRYKELLEAMVEVARKLPWGEDVNVKNVLKNSPFVLKYMEMKSLEDRRSEKAKVADGSYGFDMGDVVEECLGKEVAYVGFDDGDGSGAQNSIGRLDGEQGLENFKVSHVELAKVYSKFKEEFLNHIRMNENESFDYGDRLSGLDVRLFDDWWSGRSEMCEKLLMEPLLEKDVGLVALPPSYIRGCLAVERRREKIKAAKTRINNIVNAPTSISSKVMHSRCSSDAQSCSSGDVGSSKNLNGCKKRRIQHDSIDWETLSLRHSCCIK